MHQKGAQYFLYFLNPESHVIVGILSKTLKSVAISTTQWERGNPEDNTSQYTTFLIFSGNDSDAHQYDDFGPVSRTPCGPRGSGDDQCDALVFVSCCSTCCPTDSHSTTTSYPDSSAYSTTICTVRSRGFPQASFKLRAAEPIYGARPSGVGDENDLSRQKVGSADFEPLLSSKDLEESKQNLDQLQTPYDRKHWYFGAFLASTGELIGEGGLPDIDG